jgi:hypothetical protein
MKTKLLPLLFLCLCLPILGFAQQPSGNLEGKIVDDQGQPMIGANVVLISPDLQGQRGVVSDGKGYFQLLALPVGSYTLNISHIGYGDLEIKDVIIHLGVTTNVGLIQLSQENERINQVTVIGERPLLDPATTTLGGNFGQKTIQALPVARDMNSLVELAPQAAPAYTFDRVNLSGSTGLEHNYFIDGVHVTDPIHGFGGTDLPYNFIREIQIKTGGYEAEYRSALGGVINVVTNSGSNEFEGQVFSFLTGDFLQSDPKLIPVQTDIDQFFQADAGFGFGGPIIRDKLWFYVAYNYLRDQKEINLSDLGSQTEKLERHAFASKLTWRAGERTEVVFTAFGDPTTQDIVGNWLFNTDNLLNMDPMLGYGESGGINTSLRLNHQFNSKWLFNAAVSHYQAKNINKARTERGLTEPLYLDFVSNTGSGGYGIFQDDQAQRLAAKANSTWLLPGHTLKAGLELENIKYDQDYGWDILPGGVIYKFDENYFQSYYFRVKGRVRNFIPSAFLQDSWKISNRLRLNLGLRWNAQFIYGSDGNVAQRITDEIQPRLGVMYQPGKDGDQKVFAFYGRFYEQLPTSFLATQFTDVTEFITSFEQDPRENLSNGDTLNFSKGITPEVKGLQGQYYDEFSIGYERRIGTQYKIGLTGTYRNLGEVIEDVIDFDQGGFIMGNPGRGKLSAYPEFERTYMGLEFIFQRFGAPRFNYLVSYVLSRNYGNYPGLFDAFIQVEGFFTPNWTRQMDIPEQFPNSTGLLPNDRTHLFKFNGSYRFDFGLNVGATFLWMSGTPLTELGATYFGPPLYSYLTKRGSNGRTPGVYDLNLRLTYDLDKLLQWGGQKRIIFDLLHVGNPRKAVWLDQIRFNALNENGAPTAENPNYLQPLAFQPPMTLRVGLEVGFH